MNIENWKSIVATAAMLLMGSCSMAPSGLPEQGNSASVAAVVKTSIPYQSRFLTISSAQGTVTQIHYNRWYKSNARAVLVELSGLQSHSMWFVNFGDRFADAGYNVYSMDRRGSGQSSGRRGDIVSYQVWINDLKHMVALAKAENPNVPVHILANCFGTRIALGLAIQKPGIVDSLILTAPATHMRVDLETTEKVHLLASPTSYIPTPLNDEMFTTEPQYLAYMKSDRLAIRQATGRLFRESNALNDFVLENLHTLQTPVLSLLSKNDQVIKARKVVNQFHEALPNPHSKVVVYENVAHYILFESVWHDAMKNMVNWLGGF
jgi:alpha-beta hydrolase superfamily lysophospholipase